MMRHFSAPAAVGMAAADLGMNEIEDSNLERPALVLREALQNSHDARCDEREVLGFHVAGFSRLAPSVVRCLNETVFADWPDQHELGPCPLFGEMAAMIIADSGTHGLTGPVLASASVGSGVAPRYQSFFLQLGRNTIQDQGGGTHGIGRNALIALSRLHTLVVYTHTSNGDERLMALRLHRAYELGGHRYPGWHYWGLDGSDANHPLPLEGAEATDVAAELGLLCDLDHETGTAIMILDPDLSRADEVSTDDVADSLQAFMTDMRRACDDFALIHLLVDKDLNVSFALDGGDLAQ